MERVWLWSRGRKVNGDVDKDCVADGWEFPCKSERNKREILHLPTILPFLTLYYPGQAHRPTIGSLYRTMGLI